VEIQYTAKGIPIYCFSIANNLNKKMNNTWERVPNYFNFRLLGKRWEGISPWLIKGQLVSIQGQLEQDRWERDGKQRSSMKITIMEIQPLWPCNANRQDQNPEGEELLPLDETEGDSNHEITMEEPVGEGVYEKDPHNTQKEQYDE
jgi:single-strand DNA-binding protein